MFYNRCSRRPPWITPDKHAWTEGDTALFGDLSEEDQNMALLWVKWNLMPRKTFNSDYTSYGLKHRLEGDTRIYMTNNQFKDLMLQCGYRVKNPRELNWVFNVVLSNCAKMRADGKYPQWLYT